MDYATASKIFYAILGDKQRKGYTHTGRAPTDSDYQAPIAKEDTRLRPQLLEPITLDQEYIVRPPQYLGKRSDIERSACVPSQLKFKPGSRHLATAA